jgi:GNAT superfamily N-acetyltransferase
VIRYLSPELEASFLSALDFDCIAGARIDTLCKMAQSGYPGMLFWVQLDEGGAPLAALAAYGNRLHIAAAERADADELMHFARFTGALILCAHPFLCRFAPNARISEVTLMRHRGEGALDRGTEILTSPGLHDVYALLRDSDTAFARETDFDTWYGHTSHLMRHNLGRQCGIYRGSRLVSTGGVYASSPQYALISAVATLPDYRGRGYGRRVISCLVNDIKADGRIPVTLVADSGLIAWYESLGFEQGGRYCEAILE